MSADRATCWNTGHRIAIAIFKIHSQEIFACDSASSFYVLLTSQTSHLYSADKLLKVRQHSHRQRMVSRVTHLTLPRFILFSLSTLVSRSPSTTYGSSNDKTSRRGDSSTWPTWRMSWRPCGSRHPMITAPSTSEPSRGQLFTPHRDTAFTTSSVVTFFLSRSP